MKIKKLIATSLIVNFIGLNFSLAAEKPLPPLPKIKPQVEQKALIKDDASKSDVPIVQPQDRYLKAGYNLTVELLDSINSHTGKVGQLITAKLLLPVDLNGKIVIPEGSIVIGKITKLSKANKAGKNAVIDIKFEHIELANGYKIPIFGKIKTLDGKGILTGGNYEHQLKKAMAMGATTTAGGALAGLGVGLLSSAAAVGSVIGLIIGGVLGFGWLFFKKGKSINISSGTKLLVNLEYDVAITSIGL